MFDKKQKNYGFCKISYLDSTLNKTNHIAWTFLAFLSKVVSNNLDGSIADKCHSELKDVGRVISHKFHKPWHVLKVKPEKSGKKTKLILNLLRYIVIWREK